MRVEWSWFARWWKMGLPCRQTAGKWLRRYREQGVAGLGDRSSRPHRSPRATAAELVGRVEAHRRERWTGVRIAQHLALGTATVSRILCRLKLNRIRMLEPKTVFPRYEREAPGDLLHVDIKKFACITAALASRHRRPRDGVKGIGAEFLHIAIDDHSRVAFIAMYPDQTSSSATHFLYPRYRLLRRLRYRHPQPADRQWPLLLQPTASANLPTTRHPPSRTRPYTPRTNGKAERFIQTATPGMGLRSHLPELEATIPRHHYPYSTNTTGTDHTLDSTNKPPSAEFPMTTTS